MFATVDDRSPCMGEEIRMMRWEKRDLTRFSRRWRVSMREVRPTTATPREEIAVAERVGRMDWTTSTEKVAGLY
jgi:hypothetical protein